MIKLLNCKSFFYLLLILLIFSLDSSSLKAQNIELRGKITDTLNKPLAYSNIIAEPKNSTKISYAITDNFGMYKFNLKKNELYTIRISYIGYKPKTLTSAFNKDTIINYQLIESSETLGEIKIDASIAINFKKDTITYLSSRFITGEERKLKDILKKLPGIEVDRKGNVYSKEKEYQKY